MKRTAFAVGIVFLLAAASAHADKLKGFIWEASPSSLVVEGQTVRLAPETKVERANHKDITVKDLRIGWEVEVETRGDEGGAVIHSGLVAALESEAQLATVLGHEIAHTTHRHGFRGYKDQQGKKKWLGLGSVVAGVLVGTQTDSALAGLVTGAGTNLALKAAVNGHGRKLEDEADIIGLYYMVEAGYDYMEAPEVWRLFGKYTKDQSKVSNFFFSDHSTHAARINNLTKAINADYRASVPRTTLRTGEEQYQKAAEKLASQNAMANMQSQEYARAGRALASAIERNPNDAQAHYNLGRVLWAQGGAQNAERVLEEFGAAVQLDPKLAAPWRDIGVVLLRAARRQRRRAGLRALPRARPGRARGAEDQGVPERDARAVAGPGCETAQAVRPRAGA